MSGAPGGVALKGLVGRVPIVGPLARSAYHWTRTTHDRRRGQSRLRNAKHPFAARIAEVLAQLEAPEACGDERIAAIEKERRALLSRGEPLVDASFESPGPADQDVTIDAACRVSKPEKAARFMYLLVREFRPTQAIELGTNVGISSAYQAAGLAANGDNGRLVTLEASPYRLRIAQELHARVGLKNLDYRQGLFTETLDDSIEEFGPFDFAFIDGHHTYEGTLDYFDRVWRHAHEDALFVFDDIRWSEGMKRAWAELQSDSRIALAVDLWSVGVCVARREAQGLPRDVLSPIRFALLEDKSPA